MKNELSETGISFNDKSNNNAKNKRSNTPFDDVFRTLLEKCNKLIIPVINEVFGTKYSTSEDVLVLSNEHFVIDGDNNNAKRITDSYIKIRDNMYHLECQSTEDYSMEIRMIEYDFHIALSDMKNSKNKELVLEFPKSAVIVIRDLAHLSKDLKITIKIPQYKKTETFYNTVSYTVPVIRVSKYSKEEIFDKNLIFFIPYYIINYTFPQSLVCLDFPRKFKFHIRHFICVYATFSNKLVTD